MATDLGKVGMVMKGAWSNSAAYEVLDTVSYQNSLYTAKQAVPAGTLPTNTTYWQSAIDGAAVTDGFILKRSSIGSEAGNMFYIYMGSRTVLNINGSFSGNTSILLFVTYPNNGTNDVTKRGIYSIDRAGNIIDMSSIGGTLPTVSVNEAKTQITITFAWAYSYVFGVTSGSVTVTAS